MPPSETIDLRPLHELLKYDPANPVPLRITLTSTPGEETIISARGREVRIPGDSRAFGEHHLKTMLEHYPQEASVNGEPAKRSPFLQTPAVKRIIEKGALMHSNPVTLRINPPETGENRPAISPWTIRSEGLTYMDAAPDSRSKIAFLPAAPRPEDPPGIRTIEAWEAGPVIELPPEEARSAEYFTRRDGGIPACAAEGNGARAKRQVQLEQAEQIIRRTLPSAGEIAWEDRQSRPKQHRIMRRRIWAPGRRGAPVMPETGVITAVPETTLHGQSVVYSLTRALLQNPQLGIVPIDRTDMADAVISCRSIAVSWLDGLSATFEGEDLEAGERPTRPDQRIFEAARSCAASVTITAVLSRPAQPDRTIEIPADFAALGVVWDNCSWINGEKWRDKNPRNAAQTEFEALWEDENDEQSYDPYGFLSNLNAWWTRAMAGESAGFDQELNSLAGDFRPQSEPPDQTRTALNGTGGASLTWRPAGTWDWLDDAIRGVTGLNHDPETLKKITEDAQMLLLRTAGNTVRQAVTQAAVNAGAMRFQQETAPQKPDE